MNSIFNVDKIQHRFIQKANHLKLACKLLKSAAILGISLETTGLDPRVDRIRLIHIAASEMPLIIVDLDAIGGNLNPLRKLLTNNSLKVFQNGKFDYQFLVSANLQPGGSIFDTMLASMVLFAGLDKNHDLEALASEFLGITLLPHQLKYAPAILLELYKVLYTRLENEDLLSTALIEWRAMPAIAQMELNGMGLDKHKWLNIKSELEQKTRAAASKLKVLEAPSQLSLFVDQHSSLNLNSPKQLLSALQMLGIPIKSTSKQVLIPLAEKYPVVLDLLEYRTVSKLASIDLESHIHPTTLRIHASFNQYGARSGRFSCQNPNLQNIPRHRAIRECFVSRPGYEIIKADYSQIEMRIVAEISGDRRMVNAYNQGEDLHTLTASLITGKPFESITAEDRRLAKAVNFGLVYGMGAYCLQEYAQVGYGVTMRISEAQVFRSRFFQGYSGVAQWHQKVRDAVERGLREIRTLGGRRRQWASLPRLPEVLNSPVQGTSADITKIAVEYLSQDLRRAGAELIGLVHDEILCGSFLVGASRN